MPLHVSSPLRKLRAPVMGAIVIASLASAYAMPFAQVAAKKPLSIDDYTRWRSITGTELSPDGNWATYTLQQMNTPAADAKPELHVVNLTTNENVAVRHATGGTFSPDSRWIAYQVDPTPGRAGREGRGGTPADPAAPAVPPATPPPATPPVT
ncbi:MAG: hypothetical protein M3R55_15900, partial [Acidobacteriota bacterium]|nr:hypothetical protein [Acidobacteriota bacterium]